MKKNQLERNSLSNEIVSCATLIKVLTLRCFNEHDFEITPEQFIILDTIVRNEKIYQRQLGEILGKDRANVTRIINILENKDLVKKIIDSNGRKINRIIISEKGKNLRNKILPVISKIRESYLNDIEIEEIATCKAILEKIKNNISQNIKLQT